MSPEARSGSSPRFPVEVETPVAWGEMDAFGHVNNTVFFRYFETARIAYFDEIDFTGGPERGEVGPILHSTHCRFRRPLTYPDTVTVGARVTETAEDRLTMEYRVVSRKLEAVAAEGGGVVVSYHYGDARKAPLPERIRRRIRELEDGARAGS